MKQFFTLKGCIKLVMAVLFAVLVTGCIATTPTIYYQVSDSYKTSGIDKIGILVVRMGNHFPTSTFPLQPETDFSNRTPVYGWHGAISEESRNIYIEDQNRLNESFPFYPKTTKKPIRYFADHYDFNFYKNFSSEIYAMLAQTFIEKGYEVIDIAEISKNWGKPVAESTILEIIENSKSIVDSIAVFQYLDIGSSTSRVGSVSSERKGFIELNYSMFMFNTQTNSEVLHYKKDFPAAAVIALLNDPEIKDNPLYQGKIKKFVKGFGGWNRYFIINELPDEVVTQKLMSYIKNGFSHKDENLGELSWTGLIDVIPRK